MIWRVCRESRGEFLRGYVGELNRERMEWDEEEDGQESEGGWAHRRPAQGEESEREEETYGWKSRVLGTLRRGWKSWG